MQAATKPATVYPQPSSTLETRKAADARRGRIRLLKHEAKPLTTEKKPGVPLSSRQVERREMVYTICS